MNVIPQTPSSDVNVTELAAPEPDDIQLVRVMRGMQGPPSPSVEDIPDLATTFRNQLV